MKQSPRKFEWCNKYAIEPPENAQRKLEVREGNERKRKRFDYFHHLRSIIRKEWMSFPLGMHQWAAGEPGRMNGFLRTVLPKH